MYVVLFECGWKCFGWIECRLHCIRVAFGGKYCNRIMDVFFPPDFRTALDLISILGLLFGVKSLYFCLIHIVEEFLVKN